MFKYRGLEQLAGLDAKRLLIGLLEKKFQKSQTLQLIVDDLCKLKLRQNRFVPRYPSVAYVPLWRSEVVLWLAEREVVMEESQIPSSINENWLHHGAEKVMNKLLKLSRVHKKECPKANVPLTQSIEKETSPVKIFEPSSPLPMDHGAPALKVKEIIDTINQHDFCKKRQEELSSEMHGLKIIVQKENVMIKNTFEKINSLEAEINTQKKQQKEEHDANNRRRYNNALRNYEEGLRLYNYSLNPEISLDCRQTYWSTSLPFFASARKTLNKVENASLLPEEASNIISLNENCTFYINSQCPQKKKL